MSWPGEDVLDRGRREDQAVRRVTGRRAAAAVEDLGCDKAGRDECPVGDVASFVASLVIR